MIVIAIGELGVLCAPQHPERPERFFELSGEVGLVPIAVVALPLAGSTVTLHAGSIVKIAGRAGVVPPGVTETAQASPSRFAVIVEVPFEWGASRITCVPGGAR